MNEQEIAKLKADIITQLNEKYFLIPRNAWWAFLGGALAFAIAVGVVSYKSALKVISDPVVVAAKQTILDAKITSEKALSDINANLAKSGTAEARLSKLETTSISSGSLINLKAYQRPGSMQAPSQTAIDMRREQWTITK